MLSFITCPRSDASLLALRDNLQQALGEVAAELVFEHNPASLAAAYTVALRRARGEVLVFLHDDVAFLTRTAIAALARHAARFDVVGIAGSLRA